MGIYYLTGVFCAIVVYCQYHKFTQTNLYYVTIRQSNGQTGGLALSKYSIYTYL